MPLQSVSGFAQVGQTLQRWIEMYQFFIPILFLTVFDVCFGFSEMKMMVAIFFES